MHEQNMQWGSNFTSRHTRRLVFDYSDFIHNRKFFEHVKQLRLRHVLRHLANEQLHSLSFRHYCKTILPLSNSSAVWRNAWWWSEMISAVSLFAPNPSWVFAPTEGNWEFSRWQRLSWWLFTEFFINWTEKEIALAFGNIYKACHCFNDWLLTWRTCGEVGCDILDDVAMTWNPRMQF